MLRAFIELSSHSEIKTIMNKNLYFFYKIKSRGNTK